MKKRRKLIWHILMPYLLITLLSLFALAAYSSVALRHYLLDQNRHDLEIRLKLLEDPVRTMLLFAPRKDMDAYCKNIGRATATRITVILPGGKVIGDSSRDPAGMENHRTRPEIIGALAGKMASGIRHSNTLNKRMMYVATPLKDERDRLTAVLRVAVPITFIDDELRELQGKFAMGGLIVAFLACAISVAVARRISQPITRMKTGAQRFAAGDLSHRLPLPAGEELATLADALNRMAAEIENRVGTIVNQHNELTAILSSMQEGLIAVDRQEEIVNANRAAADMLGVDIEIIQGNAVMEVMRNLDLQDFVRRALQFPDRSTRRCLEFCTDDGRILKVHCAPLVGTKRTIMGTIVVLSDVTELRRLEDMRQNFVANVSHEIKTPLTTIKGFVETIRYGQVDSAEDTHRFLGIIERHVNRLNAIITDLLVLSRLEQKNSPGKLNLKKRRINTILQTVIQVCRAAAEKKHIVFELSCPDHLVVIIDQTLLEQALINLVDNAVKYSDAATTVYISVVDGIDNVRIHVRDQGQGIAKKHLPHIFERFYRIDKARSRKLGGTGLGLSIVKHIVQAHGGHIDVQSTPNQGSTFVIHLPVSQS